MCLAIPGRVLKVAKGVATVGYGGERREARLLLAGVKPGDFVIVQNQLVVEKVAAKAAEAWLKQVEAGFRD